MATLIYDLDETEYHAHEALGFDEHQDAFGYWYQHGRGQSVAVYE